jgi:hypothetical protein
MNINPVYVFITLQLLHNLQIDPIRYSVNNTSVERLVRDKHCTLLDPFVSYEENKAL